MSEWKVKSLEALGKQNILGVIVVDDDETEIDYINGILRITKFGKRYPLFMNPELSLDDQISRTIKNLRKKGIACAAIVRFACREGPEGIIQELVYEGPGYAIRMVSPEDDDLLLSEKMDSLSAAINYFSQLKGGGDEETYLKKTCCNHCCSGSAY